MAANTAPIFTLLGQVASNSGTGMAPTIGTLAAADYTGVSGNYKLVFTADPTNGSYLVKLRFKSAGTNIASVARVFINNGTGTPPLAASDNSFYGEVSLPAVTGSNTTATPEVEYPMGFALNPGFKIYVGLATAVANGWVCTAIGGDY